MLLYGGLTLGAETVAAIGIGVAKAPKQAPHAVYVGVRLTAAELRAPQVERALRRLGATAIVDARAAAGAPEVLETLAAEGVGIANGGMGHHRTLPWNRAKDDVEKAGRMISRRVDAPIREFAPGRGVNAFDQFFSSRRHQKVVLADETIRPGETAKPLEGRKIYLVDGRGRTARQVARTLVGLRVRIARAGLHVRPLGALR